MDFKKEYQCKIDFIDNYISNYLETEYCNVSPSLLETMKYCVLNGGKRLRSILCSEICKMLGGSVVTAMPFATAIELIHAYSLVHDDLPAMDNSDTRRGLPSCHKKYGEAMGILCGDSLLNSAYEIMASNCNEQISLLAMKCIADAAGAKGMINGQVLDLQIASSKNCDMDTLITLIEQKTMALIRAAILSGAYLSGCDEAVLSDMDKFAYHLGLAFQIRDDFEDSEQDNTDAGDSPNFVNFLGEAKAGELLTNHAKAARDILDKYENSQFLCLMLSFLFD